MEKYYTEDVNPDKAAPQAPSILRTFSRAQVSAGIATAADYGVIFVAAEIIGLWYVLAVALGALVGAITNFLMNRHWSFKGGFDQETSRWHGQAFRYAWVSAASLLLNTGGVWLVTETLKVHYFISVVAVSIAVGVFFNYPLHRNYVFR
jgi:putative flippase GtrA